MTYTREEIEAANRRAKARLAGTPTATAAWYGDRYGRVLVELSNGMTIGFRPRDAQGFEHAKPAQLRRVEISPSGLGLHFPVIDADIWLPGLLEGFLGSRRWMAAQQQMLPAHRGLLGSKWRFGAINSRSKSQSTTRLQGRAGIYIGLKVRWAFCYSRFLLPQKANARTGYS